MSLNKSEKKTNEMECEKECHLDDIIDSMGFGAYQVRLVIIFGLCQTADAMEMLLLSVIGPEVKCEWFLSDSQVALITTMVFIGMGIGATLFGWMSDTYGRLKSLVASTIITIAYGFLSSISLSYIWLLILRFIVGMGIGGIMSSLSILYTELVPKSSRGKSFILVLSFWAFGALIECAFAYLIMPRYGWRWLMAASATPLFICFYGFLFLPESPRFLLINGQAEKVMEIVNKMAKMNNKPEFKGKLILPSSSSKKGRFQDLFHKNYRFTTALLFFIWFNCGFSYYGNVLLSTTLPETEHTCLQNRMEVSKIANNVTDSSCCHRLVTRDYITLTISSSGEIISFFITIFLIDCFGRRWSLRLNPLMGALTFFLLNLCFVGVSQDIVLLLNRGFSFSGFISAFLYTSEIYPTSVRSIGFGSCSSFSRLGAVLTPFVAQLLLTKESVFSALIVYTAIALCGSLAAFCLSVETKGRVLLETVSSKADLKQAEHDQPLQDIIRSSQEYSTFKKGTNILF